MLENRIGEEPGKEHILFSKMTTVEALAKIGDILPNWGRREPEYIQGYDFLVTSHRFTLISKPSNVIEETLTITEADGQIKTVTLKVAEERPASEWRHIRTGATPLLETISASFDTASNRVTFFGETPDQHLVVNNSGGPTRKPFIGAK